VGIAPPEPSGLLPTEAKMVAADSHQIPIVMLIPIVAVAQEGSLLLALLTSSSVIVWNDSTGTE
jgi:hypothetical protein